jgi:hypothetical protein
MRASTILTSGRTIKSLSFAVTPNNRMQRSVNHKVLGRGRPASCASQPHRARVLKGRRAVADAER